MDRNLDFRGISPQMEGGREERSEVGMGVGIRKRGEVGGRNWKRGKGRRSLQADRDLMANAGSAALVAD